MTFSAIAKLELLNNVVAETTATEICHAYVASFLGFAQGMSEVIISKLVDNEQAFAFTLCLLFFIA